MAIQIDNDVPLPNGSEYNDLKRAFMVMQPGDSVVFTGNHSWIHALATAAGISVKTRAIDGRSIPKSGHATLRIWRTK